MFFHLTQLHLIIILVGVALLSNEAPAAEAINDLSAAACNEVIAELTPCAAFVKKGGSSSPSSACCSGVKDLSNIAKTKSDREAICRCFKKLLPAVGSSYDPSRIPLLPKKCGVPINLPPLDSKTDCTKSVTYMSRLSLSLSLTHGHVEN